jgi:hypothetical protein
MPRGPRSTDHVLSRRRVTRMNWLVTDAVLIGPGADGALACKRSIEVVGDRWRMVHLVSMKPGEFRSRLRRANGVRPGLHGN